VAIDPTQVRPEFFIEVELDTAASRLAGRAIERQSEMVRVIIPGHGGHYGSELVKRVDDGDRQKWPREYADFRMSVVLPAADVVPDPTDGDEENGDEVARLWRVIGTLQHLVETLSERVGYLELDAKARRSMPEGAALLALGGAPPPGFAASAGFAVPPPLPRELAMQPPPASSLDVFASMAPPRTRGGSASPAVEVELPFSAAEGEGV
jgi:hypothetical protein